MKKILVILSAVCLSVQVQAAVISGGNILPDGTILLEDGLNNAAQEAFNEAQGVVLAVDLAVNGGVIASGTRVDSHVVFYNTPGISGSSVSHTWTFSGQILGLMIDVDGGQMAASDGLFANGTYFTDVSNNPTDSGSGFAYQGLEFNSIHPDSFTFSGNVLNLTTYVSEPGDWIRVITASPVPVPAAIWLFGFALFGLMGIRRQTGQ